MTLGNYFLRYDNSIFILRKCMLKYLVVKYHNIYILHSSSSTKRTHITIKVYRCKYIDTESTYRKMLDLDIKQEKY